MNRPVLRTVGKCGASIQDTFAYNPRGELVSASKTVGRDAPSAPPVGADHRYTPSELAFGSGDMFPR